MEPQPQINHNSTPDAWDQNEDIEGDMDGPMEEIDKTLQGLNVNATPFVPGQNVFAKEFVPTIGNPTEPANNNSEDQTPDDWADKVSENGSSADDAGGGGSESGESMDTDSGEGNAEASASAKRKRAAQQQPSVKKTHLNIVFIGHVDAGKSTIGGHIMYLTGMVEKRTLEKYEKEAKEKNRESWYLSWALDVNQEERDKGKTVEVGRAYFETDNKHFTILDAPGHKSFVPNMIGGASQADIAVLVISARRGEFETGYERGGQTREHAMLVKTAGVRKLIVVVNKMDDPTVLWEEARYIEIQGKLTPYLKKCGFNPKTDIFYIPVSGLTGANLKARSQSCPWYTGPSLIEYLDGLPAVNRMTEGPVRIPILDRYKDMGTIILGKVESGVITKGQQLLVMPNKVLVEVMQLQSDDIDCDHANPGENVKVKLKNANEDDVMSGFVLCSPDNLCKTSKVFDAQIVIMEHESIICAGYSAVMHIHTSAEEVAIKALICLIDKKTGEKSRVRPRFVKQDQIAIVRLEVTGGLICLEPFKEFPQMGRFTLRDEGKTIAIGKVLKLIE